MPAHIRFICLAAASSLVLLLGLVCNTFAQQPRPQDQTEVVRVYTDLVQTDVTVFDRAGSFVEGLRKEDFELRIDGKPRPIEFFERVTVGAANEESQLMAARGTTSPDRTLPAAVPLDRGRTVFFYVDDMHLATSSLGATLKMINAFLDNEMSQNDEVAISSASGVIGFLQQLTDNKAVLRAALQRIKPRPYSNRDIETPPMTEYQALLVNRFDRSVLDYFAEETMRRSPGISRANAENIVQGRATMLLQQGANVTRITLAGLEGLVKASRRLSGRKLVFFISDGFFIDNRSSDTLDRLRRITSDAAKSGVVIYSLDARGLTAPFSDPTQEAAFDPSGRLASASQGELFASQDALNGLARDTGGRPFFGSNSLDIGLSRALKETSAYYLLAWKPEQGTESNKFRRIEVRLIDKPKLTARVRRGFFDVDPVVAEGKENNKKPASKTPDVKIRDAIAAPYPDRGLPVALSLTYRNTPEGMQLSSSMQIPSMFLKFSPEDGKEKASVLVAGSFFNERGQAGARFVEQITVTALNQNYMKTAADSVQYTFPVNLKPGLYHVRVAALDEKSGRTGSAHAWVEIPDLSSRQLTTSSLIIALKSENAVNNKSGNGEPLPENVRFSIDHQFKRDSYLRFFIFVYNAKRASDSLPDVAIQVQILRDKQPVLTTALKKLSTEGVDLERLPYAADLSLAGLSTGRYVLQVTVIDRVSKTSASQQTRFDIE